MSSTAPAAMTPPDADGSSAPPQPYVPDDFGTWSLEENIEELPPLE